MSGDEKKWREGMGRWGWGWRSGQNDEFLGLRADWKVNSERVILYERILERGN